MFGLNTMTKLLVLESAKEDFSALKRNFSRTATAQRFDVFKACFGDLFADMKTYPAAGVPVAEASALGIEMRQRLTEQTRVIYSFDEARDTIYVRMFVHTSRDFSAHLEARLLRP